MSQCWPEGVPQVMSLRGVLAAFIEHRIEVLRRRTRHRLSEIARRLEVLQGQWEEHLDWLARGARPFWWAGR